MSTDVIWVNGELRDGALPAVSAFDHGITVGDGVFETLRVYRGEPFEWERHDDRLRRSASFLGLAVPDTATLAAAARAVLAANDLQEARLRITITGGPSPLGSGRGTGPATVIIAAGALGPPAATTTAVVAPWTRNEHGATAGLKTISYAGNVRALAYAHERGATEALFANTRGELCEGTGSNIFVVADGRVLTPPESSGCLIGVSRLVALELCAELGIESAETALAVSALFECEEVFLTSSTREVQAVSHVDNHALPAPGPITAHLAAAFAARTARD